jgi:hypothetical protein
VRAQIGGFAGPAGLDGPRGWLSGLLAALGGDLLLVHEFTVDEKTPRSLKTVRSLKIAAIRYLNSFVKRGGTWFIRQRQIVVDWTKTQGRRRSGIPIAVCRMRFCVRRQQWHVAGGPWAWSQ